MSMKYYNSVSTNESEMASKSERKLENIGTLGEPIERLRLLCLSRGATGLLGLGRMFRHLDRNGDKQLNEEEFLLALRETGMEITKEEANEIYQQFDTDGAGINIDEFLKAVHPPMSESRKFITEKAFSKMDKNDDGEITISDMKNVYNVQYHPLYRSGEHSEEAIFNRFLGHFELGAVNAGRVTREDFLNYYAAISASIEQDGYYDLMMRQCYKL